MGRKANLDREAWIDAGLAWIAEHGVASLAVEPLARTLGVTKGGFYWCFANRDELLQAMLERWEARGTAEIIRGVEQVPDQAVQARELIMRVASTVEAEADEPTPAARLQYALLSAQHDPLVGPAVQRVTAARVAFLAKVLQRAGLAPAMARQRATLGYASYVGLVMLRATPQGNAAARASQPRLGEAFLAMLLAPTPASAAVAAGRVRRPPPRARPAGGRG
ncbi:MAG: TetR/AcrR family transcriptional regulator [Burkholderiales bacterium]|nr:TetR/AcrR family transcriptional regulator [Burkholderiales bacterium]